MHEATVSAFKVLKLLKHLNALLCIACLQQEGRNKGKERNKKGGWVRESVGERDEKGHQKKRKQKEIGDVGWERGGGKEGESGHSSVAYLIGPFSWSCTYPCRPPSAAHSSDPRPSPCSCP